MRAHVRGQDLGDWRRQDGHRAFEGGLLGSCRLRHAAGGKKLLAGIEKKHGTGKALSILAHKIGRAVFYMLSRGTIFSMEKFLAA